MDLWSLRTSGKILDVNRVWNGAFPITKGFGKMQTEADRI